jgi:hypothetical protein
MNSCLAIKADGDQCTRHQAAGERHYCSQHAKSAKNKKVERLGTIEPWVLMKLPVPDARNTKRYIQKIRTHLNKSPPSKDQPGGFIYVFYLPHERDLHYYKIGYTERPVEERLEEWGEKHKLELAVSYGVKANVHKTESLIHLYLAYCRLYRTPNAHGFHSVYKVSGKVIQDGQQNRKDDERLVAKSKEIEWFCAPLKEILATIEGILKIK